MGQFELPEDLADLERVLASRPIPPPSPDLRGRVIAAIRRRSAGGPPGESISIWRFTAAVTAVLALCLNLSMSAANHADWDVWPRPQQRDVSSVARELSEAVPELSEQEAFRVALVMESCSRLILAPDLKGRSRWSLALGLTVNATSRREIGNGLRPGVD